jgi:PAT family beta-lactamase induction signal transducer AmpG
MGLQLGLAISIFSMGAVDPVAEPLWLATLAIVVAFLSASQDVVIDAYKADILAPPERAAGSAAYVLGYRVAMLVTGTVALIASDHVPWRVIYGGMALLMVVGAIATLVAEEPGEPADAPTSLASSLTRPFIELYRRLGLPTLALVLGLAALYRFGDFFAQALIIPFLKKGVGFTSTEVGVVNKALGFVGTLVGGVAAGSLVSRHGARRLLVPFAIAAAFTNFFYMLLAITGRDMTIFCTAVLIDHVTTALATTAFLAVLMGATSAAVSATQFALLTSLSSVGQRLFGFLADDVVAAGGWTGFFAMTVALAIPGVVFAWLVARTAKIEI